MVTMSVFSNRTTWSLEIGEHSFLGDIFKIVVFYSVDYVFIDFRKRESVKEDIGLNGCLRPFIIVVPTVSNTDIVKEVDYILVNGGLLSLIDRSF